MFYESLLCVRTLLAVHLLTTSATWLEADPFENWVPRLPDIRFLEDVTFGNDAFVAVGSSGQIFSSKHGADWAIHGSIPLMTFTA